jgi:hypothetical protein
MEDYQPPFRFQPPVHLLDMSRIMDYSLCWNNLPDLTAEK